MQTQQPGADPTSWRRRATEKVCELGARGLSLPSPACHCFNMPLLHAKAAVMQKTVHKASDSQNQSPCPTSSRWFMTCRCNATEHKWNTARQKSNVDENLHLGTTSMLLQDLIRRTPSPPEVNEWSLRTIDRLYQKSVNALTQNPICTVGLFTSYRPV